MPTRTLSERQKSNDLEHVAEGEVSEGLQLILGPRTSRRGTLAREGFDKEHPAQWRDRIFGQHELPLPARSGETTPPGTERWGGEPPVDVVEAFSLVGITLD